MVAKPNAKSSRSLSFVRPAGSRFPEQRDVKVTVEALFTLGSGKAGKVWHPTCLAEARRLGRTDSVTGTASIWPVPRKCEWCKGGAFGPNVASVGGKKR